MPQAVTLQADLVFRLSEALGGRLISIPSGTVITFPGAASLDAAAEILAGISRSALAANIAQFNREDLVSGVSTEITHGPGGEKLSVGQGAPPAVATATVEDAADTIVVVTFDMDVNSGASDFKTGFSCKVDGVARTISSAAQQANNAIVKLTLASAVTEAQVVLLSYDKTTGDLESDTGSELQSFTDAAVTNNVAA